MNDVAVEEGMVGEEERMTSIRSSYGAARKKEN
jgi:hypothetical protein